MGLKPISIVEALSQVDLAKTSMQVINKALIRMAKKRDHTALTFATDVTPSELVNNSRVGVIVWMDKSEYDKMVAFANGGGEK